MLLKSWNDGLKRLLKSKVKQELDVNSINHPGVISLAQQQQLARLTSST